MISEEITQFQANRQHEAILLHDNAPHYIAPAGALRHESQGEVLLLVHTGAAPGDFFAVTTRTLGNRLEIFLVEQFLLEQAAAHAHSLTARAQEVSPGVELH